FHHAQPVAELLELACFLPLAPLLDRPSAAVELVALGELGQVDVEVLGATTAVAALLTGHRRAPPPAAPRSRGRQASTAGVAATSVAPSRPPRSRAQPRRVRRKAAARSGHRRRVQGQPHPGPLALLAAIDG